MRLAVVLALLLASRAACAIGPDPLRTDEPAGPWVTCSQLPDPAGATTTALTTATSAADLHTDIMAVCSAGCIVTLAAGTYDGNVVFGDSALKAGSITPTGDVVIRGADRANPPVIRATPDLNAAVIHAKNVTARIRLEDLILDGRRDSQTSAAFSPVCTDLYNNPAAGGNGVQTSGVPDGVCDGTNQSIAFLNGFNTRSTSVAGQTSSCLLRVQVRETASTGIQLSQPFASTVEASTVTGAGCTTALCPALSIPADFVENAMLKTAMGVQMVDGIEAAVINSSISSVTKIGIECFTTMRRCHMYNNAIDEAFMGGIVFNEADGEAVRNRITRTGLWLTPNKTTDNIGMGIQFVGGDATATTPFNVSIVSNTITGAYNSGIQIGLSSPTLNSLARFRVHQNVVSDTCDGSTRTDAASLEIGDSTAKTFPLVLATGNQSLSTACPDGFRIRNLERFTGWANSTTAGVEVDDVRAFDWNGGVITGSLDIDVDTRGRAMNCTLTGSVVGAANVTRRDCGA